MASTETRKMVLAATAACEEKKAEDTRILELDPADSGFTDFFLITSAANDRQAQAIGDEIQLRLKRDFGTYPHSVEGRKLGEWILMDYVDFVVHIFLTEKRAFYDLERLWKSARTVDLEELKAALKEKNSGGKEENSRQKNCFCCKRQRHQRRRRLPVRKPPRQKRKVLHHPTARRNDGARLDFRGISIMPDVRALSKKEKERPPKTGGLFPLQSSLFA